MEVSICYKNTNWMILLNPMLKVISKWRNKNLMLIMSKKEKSPCNHSPIFKRWNRATYCWDHKSNSNAIDYEKYVWTNTRAKHFCFRTRLATFQSKEGDSMINFFKWLNDITSQLVNIEKIVVEKDSGNYYFSISFREHGIFVKRLDISIWISYFKWSN